jgi:Tfp pilus assembly protein PilO
MTKTRQWTVFTAIAVIVVLLAGWFLLVKPQSTKASTLRSEATTQQASNALIQTQIASLQNEQAQLPEQQKELQKFATQVPADASEPAAIRQLSAAATGSGVNLVSLTPGTASAVAVAGAAPGSTALTAPSSSAGQLVQLPVTLAILGSYANVESFFLSLEKLPRALLVTGWSLCPTTGSSATSAVSCTPPAAPSNFTPPPGVDELGGTISATVFYAPPAGTAVSTTPVAPTGTASTAPATTASTPASSTPTVASSAPAN